MNTNSDITKSELSWKWCEWQWSNNEIKCPILKSWCIWPRLSTFSRILIQNIQQLLVKIEACKQTRHTPKSNPFLCTVHLFNQNQSDLIENSTHYVWWFLNLAWNLYFISDRCYNVFDINDFKYPMSSTSHRSFDLHSIIVTVL